MNRQVPEKIAIVGNGKVAHHMIQYFGLVGQPFVHWFRESKANQSVASGRAQSKLAAFKRKLQSLIKPQSLAAAIERVDTVLLLIPDDQIESFIRQNPVLKGKTCVHFSGSLNTELAIGCHPLMTFGADLYDLESYQSIPFVVDEGVEFKTLFPLFKNPTHGIQANHKALYHAYCVMAGNFSQMLWKTLGHELEQINLPKDLMSQYLLQNTKNFINNPEKSATGPFVRGDFATIEKHQQALRNHPLSAVYQTFYNLHQTPELSNQRRHS